MNILAFNTLRSYYIADPVAFMAVLSGNSTTAQIYKSMINEMVLSLQLQYNSVSAKIINLDMDGNMLFANNDAYFGHTKDDVKNVSSRIQKAGESEYLVADGLGKRAFIIKTSASDYVGIIESMYVDPVEQEDADFLNAVFGSIQTIINFPKVIWQYSSGKYITSFYLIPAETQEISICDDAIRDADVWIRQGTEVKFLNNSNKPVRVYSGNTNYDQFVLNPNLNLYGKKFKSPVIQPGSSWSYRFVTVEEDNYFIYPDILTGKISITRDRLNANDEFLVAESDNLGQPFSSRAIRVDSWGNVVKSFGESYLVNPRNIRPMLNGGMVISC